MVSCWLGWARGHTEEKTQSIEPTMKVICHQSTSWPMSSSSTSLISTLKLYFIFVSSVVYKRNLVFGVR